MNSWSASAVSAGQRTPMKSSLLFNLVPLITTIPKSNVLKSSNEFSQRALDQKELFYYGREVTTPLSRVAGQTSFQIFIHWATPF